MKVSYYREGADGSLSNSVEPPSVEHAHLECAMRGLSYAEAMFAVLGFVRGSGLDDFEGGADTLQDFAALGQMVCGAAYSHLMELPEAYARPAQGKG